MTVDKVTLAAGAVARFVRAQGAALTPGVVRRGVSVRYRPLFDDAVALALRERWIAFDGPRFVRGEVDPLQPQPPHASGERRLSWKEHIEQRLSALERRAEMDGS